MNDPSISDLDPSPFRPRHSTKRPPDFVDDRLAELRTLGPAGDHAEPIGRPYGLVAPHTHDVLDTARVPSNYMSPVLAAIV